MMNRRGLFLFVLLGVIGPAAFYLLRSDAAVADEGVRRTSRVTRSSIQQTVIATGVIRPSVGAEVNVGSRISGTVVRLPVEIGDTVEAGQLLAELESAALETAVDEARAEFELATPRVSLASSTLERRRRLATDGLLSGEELEIASSNLAIEQRRLEASEARLRAAEIVLGYTRIVAPISGVIAEVTTREGETVAAGFSAPTFVTIIDLDRLEVLAYVDETDIGHVETGQTATFNVDTYPDVEFPAVVTAIQPAAELQGSVVNYVVRLQLLSTGELVLRPEMTAHVRILVEERDQVLKVPRSALRFRNARQFVVVERNGEWVEQEVQTAWRSEEYVEIVSGIEEGDVLELKPD